MILPILSKVKDGRRAESRQYDLPHILLFSICALMSSASSYREIATYIEEHFPYLKRKFKLKWRKTPSYSSIRRAIIQLDSETLEEAFREYSAILVDENEPSVFATDGKTLRGSYDHQNGQEQLQLLSCFAVKKKIIIGHKETFRDKTNEIPLYQELIEELNLPKGSILMADALHTQKKR